MSTIICFCLIIFSQCMVITVDGSDWPQLGRDSGRTGHAPQGVAPPFQARWIWCGPNHILRNQASNAAWKDNLSPGAPDFSMPEKTQFTFSGQAQPIVVAGKVIIGDMEGNIYCLSLDDGRTLWIGANYGGTCASVAYCDGLVIANALSGKINGLDATNGKYVWEYYTRKAITSAPLVVGSMVFSGCHDGSVYAINAKERKLIWISESLGAPIVSDLCGDSSAIYVGAENLGFNKLDIQTGKILAKTQLNGQSFRMTYPVLYQNKLFVQTVQPICVGSEYVMEGVMRDSPDIETEQNNILRWLKGDTNNGRWQDASPAWKHLFVLSATDLSEPYTVPNGPADGCGSPAPSPTIDAQGRVLAWFKTAYPTLTASNSFGTKYSMDISAIDLSNGRRIPIDQGRLSGTTGETDNLFALSSGGPYLYMRQRFRGTKMIDLEHSTSHFIQATLRKQDGGTWNADVVYKQTSGIPRTSQPALGGREAVVIAGDKLLVSEPYCVTCIEHRKP